MYLIKHVRMLRGPTYTLKFLREFLRKEVGLWVDVTIDKLIVVSMEKQKKTMAFAKAAVINV